VAQKAGEGAVDLSEWPESRQAWDQGVITKLPSPYYGLESTVFVGGHTSWIWGEYVNWIKAEHPDALPAVYGREFIEDWTPRCGEHAFKSAVPEELHYNRYIADETCKFLEQKAADGGPFFCWASFPDPHHSYVAPRPHCDWYDPKDMPLPTRREGELDSLPPFYRTIYEEGARQWKLVSGRSAPTRHTDDELRHIWAMTYAMVSCTDAAIGRVLDKLDQTGLAENTVVCFLADHGDMLGDHWMVNKGPFHFDGLLRMPMIWSWPGRIPAGARTDTLACQVDFAPTVLDLCDVPIPEGPHPETPEAPCQKPPWPGCPLTPVLTRTARSVRDYVIVENDEDYIGASIRSYITRDHKLTIYSGRPDWGELFDRRKDPKELNNLWNARGSQRLKNKLIRELAYVYLDEETPLPRRLTHA
jgi:arylsulfatase